MCDLVDEQGEHHMHFNETAKAWVVRQVKQALLLCQLQVLIKHAYVCGVGGEACLRI